MGKIHLLFVKAFNPIMAKTAIRQIFIVVGEWPNVEK